MTVKDVKGHTVSNILDYAHSPADSDINEYDCWENSYPVY